LREVEETGMNPVTVAELAAALIAVFEGCRLTAYQDSGGVWTIGIGHTTGVAEGQVITMAQAQAFFAEDQAPLLAKVGAGKGIADAAALVSFGFNCGMGALERVMAGQATLDQFVHDGHGNVLPGLVARRHLEETLMLYGQQVST
jgi:lysozyme